MKTAKEMREYHLKRDAEKIEEKYAHELESIEDMILCAIERGDSFVDIPRNTLGSDRILIAFGKTSEDESNIIRYLAVKGYKIEYPVILGEFKCKMEQVRISW